jgi:CRISPR-associated protein Cas2
VSDRRRRGVGGEKGLHVIIAYDIAVERLPKVYQLMKQYLNWIQNSAFEGDLSPGQLEELRIKVHKVIDRSSDCIVVFSMDNPKWLDRTVWGREKGSIGAVI